ncbi:MAG: GNAT family N-acetyltransferase [Devosia sp.]|nr:GNAT family N-acetyltransferase [Devosia sp.]
MDGPTLRGRRVLLRPASAGDLDARLSLGTDPDIHRMFGGSHSQLAPLTSQGAEHWLRGLLSHPHAWVIETDRLIGEIRLDRLEPVDRRANLAIGILDPAALGRGYGPEAINLLLAHAFNSLGLHRVGLRVVAYNERAIRAYAKCGFVVEGCEREAALVDGVFHDDILMGILAAEFASSQP